MHSVNGILQRTDGKEIGLNCYTVQFQFKPFERLDFYSTASHLLDCAVPSILNEIENCMFLSCSNK